MSSEYSSNHAHITGEFGELLVLYWLSKNGYESVHAQHVGIDIIASKNGKRLGISVKSRSRKEGKLDFSLTMNDVDNQMMKVKDACLHFDCEPYFAFVVDQIDTITVVVTPLSVIETYYPGSSKSSRSWNILKLSKDGRTSMFEIDWKTKGTI
ncbi:hypothetical protein [Robertmurraya sp. FSL R5-0851]|uniref:hypothetical protein n=1 Tax=Robertmurraya sp. FSL R5-0851 TaxID=2921584 RepID=UPI0030FAE83B